MTKKYPSFLRIYHLFENLADTAARTDDEFNKPYAKHFGHIEDDPNYMKQSYTMFELVLYIANKPDFNHYELTNYRGAVLRFMKTFGILPDLRKTLYGELMGISSDIQGPLEQKFQSFSKTFAPIIPDHTPENLVTNKKIFEICWKICSYIYCNDLNQATLNKLDILAFKLMLFFMPPIYSDKIEDNIKTTLTNIDNLLKHATYPLQGDLVSFFDFDICNNVKNPEIFEIWKNKITEYGALAMRAMKFINYPNESELSVDQAKAFAEIDLKNLVSPYAKWIAITEEYGLSYARVKAGLSALQQIKKMTPNESQNNIPNIFLNLSDLGNIYIAKMPVSDMRIFMLPGLSNSEDHILSNITRDMKRYNILLNSPNFGVYVVLQSSNKLSTYAIKWDSLEQDGVKIIGFIPTWRSLSEGSLVLDSIIFAPTSNISASAFVYHAIPPFAQLMEKCNISQILLVKRSGVELILGTLFIESKIVPTIPEVELLSIDYEISDKTLYICGAIAEDINPLFKEFSHLIANKKHAALIHHPQILEILHKFPPQVLKILISWQKIYCARLSLESTHKLEKTKSIYDIEPEQYLHILNQYLGFKYEDKEIAFLASIYSNNAIEIIQKSFDDWLLIVKSGNYHLIHQLLVSNEALQLYEAAPAKWALLAALNTKSPTELEAAIFSSRMKEEIFTTLPNMWDAIIKSAIEHKDDAIIRIKCLSSINSITIFKDMLKEWTEYICSADNNKIPLLTSANVIKLLKICPKILELLSKKNDPELLAHFISMTLLPSFNNADVIEKIIGLDDKLIIGLLCSKTALKIFKQSAADWGILYEAQKRNPEILKSLISGVSDELYSLDPAEWRNIASFSDPSEIEKSMFPKMMNLIGANQAIDLSGTDHGS